MKNVLGSLCQNKVFVLLVLSLSGLYFIVTGLQYWISDYLQEVLQIEAKEVYYYYAVTTMSAPLMGVIFGGITFSALGGYNRKSSFVLCVIIAVIAAILSLPVPFLS